MEHSTSYANSEMHQPCSSQLPSSNGDCQFGQGKSYRECYQSIGTLDGDTTPSQLSNKSDFLSAVRIQEYLLEPMYSWMKPKKGDATHFGMLPVPF